MQAHRAQSGVGERQCGNNDEAGNHMAEVYNGLSWLCSSWLALRGGPAGVASSSGCARLRPAVRGLCFALAPADATDVMRRLALRPRRVEKLSMANDRA